MVWGVELIINSSKLIARQTKVKASEKRSGRWDWLGVKTAGDGIAKRYCQDEKLLSADWRRLMVLGLAPRE